MAVVIVGWQLGEWSDTAGGDQPESVALASTPPETVTVETVPDVCLEALDLAEDLIELSVEAMGHAGDAMAAVSTFDADGINAASGEIEAMTPEVQLVRAAYDQAAGECRAAA